MIYGVNTIDWDDSSWKHLSLIGDEEVISLSQAKVYVFSDSALCLGNMNENPESNFAWEEKLTWFKSSSQYRTLDTIDGEPMDSSGIFSQDSPHCSSATKSKSSCLKMSVEPEEFTGRIIFMSMFNDISWGSDGPGSEKKWYSTRDSKPQGEWDKVAELMMIKFGENGHPVFRATSPLPRGTLKGKGGGKLSIHFCAEGETIETVFRTIISVNQLSIYGAVSDLCDEYKACHVRAQRLVMTGQSNPLFVKHVHLRPKILYKKIHCKSTKNEWKGYHNKIV